MTDRELHLAVKRDDLTEFYVHVVRSGSHWRWMIERRATLHATAGAQRSTVKHGSAAAALHAAIDAAVVYPALEGE